MAVKTAGPLQTRQISAHIGVNGIGESQGFCVDPYGGSVKTRSTLWSGSVFMTTRASPSIISIVKGLVPFKCTRQGGRENAVICQVDDIATRAVKLEAAAASG